MSIWSYLHNRADFMRIITTTDQCDIFENKKRYVVVCKVILFFPKYGSLRGILYKYLNFHSYKISIIHKLHPIDFNTRKLFVQIILKKFNVNLKDLSLELFILLQLSC